jgi:hypothetical protein
MNFNLNIEISEQMISELSKHQHIDSSVEDLKVALTFSVNELIDRLTGNLINEIAPNYGSLHEDFYSKLSEIKKPPQSISNEYDDDIDVPF